MAHGSSYIGTDLYFTAYDAEKPTEADKINRWRSASNLFSFRKAEIELECTDGDGASDWTTGKRTQEDTILDVHNIDTASIEKLDNFALASAREERLKMWAKPAPLIGEETSKAFVTDAIITARIERDANGSNGQGVTYTIKKPGMPTKWDGILG